MSNILVTGVNGFVGQHLAKEIAASGHTVFGVSRENKVTPEIKSVITEYIACDLTKTKDVENIPFSELDAVINLAGLATVGQSFDKAELFMEVNVAVLSVMCARIRQLGLKKLRIIAASTGTVYSPKQDMPLTENSAVDGLLSPYAASKLAMEEYANKFYEEGFDCAVVRPFNHIGPGQAPGFIIPDLYEKVVNPTGNKMMVGNLETQRDFTDVRDVARAYILLATKKSLGHLTYNVCSGRYFFGLEILQTIMKVCDRTDIETVVDKELFRPSDTPILFGDNNRLHKETGWSPTIPLEQTILDYVEWRKITRA